MRRQCGGYIFIIVLITLGVMLHLFNHYNARYTSVTLTGSSSDSAEFFAEVNSLAHPHCLHFRERFAIAVDPHVDMDIAFTLVVHKDVGQIARLLRMIYRQNNYYCIHADRRSDFLFTEALRGVATCFGTNVELVPHEQRVEVHWGYESVLVPQITCAKQALRSHATWKYLVNLVGQDFPLRTNLELVAALKALNGSNLVESVELGRFAWWTNNKLLPLGVTWYKGSMYGAFRREFLHEAVIGTALGPIRDLMLQPGDIMHPDELFFPTLA
uniref:Protein xylosyltransferase n=1 Tax=Mesocestoides corti TaxID=53468 RepID=A0A5K3FUX3_MESCO